MEAIETHSMTIVVELEELQLALANPPLHHVPYLNLK